jgi:hypothetical protein
LEQQFKTLSEQAKSCMIMGTKQQHMDENHRFKQVANNRLHEFNQQHALPSLRVRRQGRDEKRLYESFCAMLGQGEGNSPGARRGESRS